MALSIALMAPTFVLSANVGCAQPVGAQPAAEVVLLIDRSGSAQSQDYGPQRAQFAQFLADTIRVESMVASTPVHLAIADFGGTVVERSPLSPLGEERVSIPVDTKAIALTDFREPLRYATSVFRSPAGPRRVVVLLTDGIPQLNERSLAASELPEYFGTLGSAARSKYSVRSVLSELAATGADPFVLVAGERPADTIAWRDVLPPGRFLSITDTESRQVAARAVLSSLALPHKPSPGPEPTPTSDSPSHRIGDEPPFWRASLRSFSGGILLMIVISFVVLTGLVALVRQRSRQAKQLRSKVKRLEGELEVARTVARGGIFIQKSEEERQEGLSALEKGDRDEARRRFLLSAGYTLAYVDEGNLLATSNANVIYNDVHDKLFPHDTTQQLDFIRELVSEALSPRGVEIIAHVLRERWQREPHLFLQEFYEIQLWPKGSELVEELAVYSPASTGDPASDASGHLIEQVALQAKRLNSLVGGLYS